MAINDSFADDVAFERAADGSTWIAVSTSKLDDEYVETRRISAGGAVTDFGRISELHAHRPSLSTRGQECVVGAAELRDGRLHGVVARFPEEAVVWRSRAEGDVANVTVVATRSGAWVACDDITADGMRVFAECIDDELAQELEIEAARTPVLAAGDDAVWLACIATSGGKRRVELFRYRDEEWEFVVKLEGVTAEAPALTVIDDVAVVAWHEEVDAGIRWLRVAAIVDGEARDIEVPRPPEFNRATAPTDQGWEFPDVAAWKENDEICIALAGRSAQNFHVAFGDLDGLGERVVQSDSGWGGCGRKSSLAGEGDDLMLGRRDRQGIVVAPVVREAEPLEPERPYYGDEEVGAPAPQEETGHVLFGQFHQHSAHSDGTGSVWDVLLRSKASGVDFTALTDHDRFCGKAIGPATWRSMQVVSANLEDDDFVVLPAVEFTGARHPGPGHKNVYFEGDVPDVIPEHTIDELKQMLVDHPAIVIPHHVGFTGWDIEHHDPDFQPLWEICSVHGVYEEQNPDTVFAPRGDSLIEEHTLRAALDAGHRFGFCAGTDDHGLLYHHGATPRRDPSQTGLTGLVGADRTRPSILAALRNRRCYATTGAKILLDVTLDGEPMGSDLTARSSGVLRVEVTGTAPLAGVDIVRNGSVETVEEESFERRLDFDGSGYVYVRVRQVDQDMAWSSPFFVG